MIDLIGKLYEPEPTNPDGQPVLLHGWHVNVTSDFMDEHPELEAYQVAPAPLLRVWAGDDHHAPVETIPLRFADEAAARLAAPVLFGDPAR
ncbi:hypothetical protein HNP32_001305 [Brevundimonas bullata]|uniref:Uncharacterized protein n=1 Tax=Brevundimonas bullata TaxID=13160 RepID=A0A7W7N3Q2_9CAUL|nr:hypothetical protein [Brevundimonas bullata]MBB4797581.1 hypothetical protein [Brevundimonas bullata]MBB6382541.1 hypothetical protein [Brevundimonas bullata]